MVDVMVSCIVLEENVENVAREPKPTVIVNSLHHREAKEENCCLRSHARDQEGNGTPKCVQKETFKGMVVKGSDCIRNNQLVMLRVYVTIQKLVLMHVTMHKILPRIHHYHCYKYLDYLNCNRWLYQFLCRT